MTRALILLSVTAVAAVVAVPSSSAAGDLQEPKVACWNKTFPNEQGTKHPQFYRSPRRCIIFKDGAIAYAFGVVRGYKLHWKTWGQRKAKGSGKIFISTAGFFPVKIRLTKPRRSCGRLVFSKINYEFRAQGRTFRNKFHPYTC